MSDDRCRGARDLSKDDAMPTEDLAQILRLDAETPEDQEPDTEALLYIMEVLAERKRNSDDPGYTARESYESFKRSYLPIQEAREDPPCGAPARKPARWRRSLTAAAAVLAVVLCCSLTAKALGYDLWNVVAVWAQETFHFSTGEQEISEPTPSDGMAYASLQEALTEYKIDANLVPTWFPEGYEFVEVRVSETPVQDIYTAIYKNDDKTIRIIIRSYLDGEPEQIERSDNFSEIYELKEVCYYIFENCDQIRVAWIRESFACCISGPMTVQEAKKMLDSIEER